MPSAPPPLYRTVSGRFALGRELPEDPVLTHRALNVLKLSTLSCVWGILAMIASLWTGALYISFGLAFVSTGICPLIAWAAVRLRSKPLCVVSLVINAALFIVFMSYFSAAFSLNTTTRMPPALIISLIFTSFMALTEVATVVSLIYLIQHPLFSAPPRFVGPANSELVRSGGVPATSDPVIVVTQSDIITYFPPQSHQPVPLPYPQYNANAYPSCPLPPPSPPPPTSTLPPTSPTPTPKHPSTTSKANVVDTRVATSTSTPGRGSSSSVLPPTLPPPSVKERNQQLTSTPSAAVASSLR